MTDDGKITGTLEETATSAEVEIGGAKWSLIRDSNSEFFFRCVVGDGTTNLWSCTARGRLIVWDSRNGRQFLVWSDSFDHHHWDGTRTIFEFPDCKLGKKVKFTAEIEVMKMRIVDLSAPPPNKSTESPKDAACLEVEDKKLWVSKQILSVHSPFFEKMFSSDFKEKATGIYALKEVDTDNFERFLSILYDMNITIDKQQPLEGLLRLGDMWQCDAVLRFCQDIISRPDSTFLTLKAKIELCDRHGFCLILEDTIRNAELEDLKKLVKRGHLIKLSSFAHCIIELRLVDSDRAT